MPASHPESLTISGTKITYQHIREGNFPDKLFNWELQTLTFCKDWLTGKEEFTLFTSGSTGTPKSVSFTRQQMAMSAHLTGKALGLQAGDKALITLPTQYIGGRMMLVRGFELGLHLTILPPSSLPLDTFAPDTLFDFLSFVPLQLQATLNQTPEKLSILNKARAILVGGAPVSLSLQRQLQQLQAPVFHTYGMTETISHIALRRLNGEEQTSSFIALEGVQFTKDERGCLVIQTPLVGNKPLFTNDLVTLHSPNTFEWLGRIDNVINSGGVKIQAEKIEKAVEQVFAQLLLDRRFFIAPLPDSLLGEKTILFIEGQRLNEAIEMKINERLSELISKYEIPKAIIYVSVFQETLSGKLDRKGMVNTYLVNG